MKSSSFDRGGSCLRLQAEAALVAGLSYVGAASAAAVSAASASTLVNEIIVAATTGSVGGLVGLFGAVLVRQIRGTTPADSVMVHHATGGRLQLGPQKKGHAAHSRSQRKPDTLNGVTEGLRVQCVQARVSRTSGAEQRAH
jgi:hypothetical protein